MYFSKRKKLKRIFFIKMVFSTNLNFSDLEKNFTKKLIEEQISLFLILKENIFLSEKKRTCIWNVNISNIFVDQVKTRPNFTSKDILFFTRFFLVRIFSDRLEFAFFKNAFLTKKIPFFKFVTFAIKFTVLLSTTQTKAKKKNILTSITQHNVAEMCPCIVWKCLGKKQRG